MYSGMTKSALEWQIKIRKFVDNELIPWEVHAEKNEGELPKDIEKKHREIAISRHHKIDKFTSPPMVRMLFFNIRGQITRIFFCMYFPRN